MNDKSVLDYIINEPAELNFSYMPFIHHGGLFVPTTHSYTLGEEVTINLRLPGKAEPMVIVGKVVWITPNNALHHVLAGIGVQFTGADARVIKVQLENMLDKTLEAGGYTYGVIDDSHHNPRQS